MKIQIGKRLAHVTRDSAREHYRNESAFWYALRNALRAKGRDVIKKEMIKDGHMTSERVYYVRARKQPGLMLWDEQYAVRNVASDFNTAGCVTLRAEE